MPTSRHHATAAAVCLTLAITGCSTGKLRPLPAAAFSKVVLPPGSTQPFDAIRGDLLKDIDDSLRRYDYRCAAAAGFTPTPISKVREPFHDLKFREGDFGTTDLEVARRDGLLAGGELIDPSNEAPNQTARTAEEIARCDRKARALLTKDTTAAYDDYMSLANDLASQYFTKMSTQYQPFRLRLFTCVETKGWHADDRTALSNDADLRKHYRVATAQPRVNAATGKETYLPTQNETSLAVALATCRQQTGYSRNVFARSRQIQGQIVAVNEAKLAEGNARLAQAAAETASRLA